MANTIQIARSATFNNASIPNSLAYGELGWVNHSKRLFIGRATTALATASGTPTPYEIRGQIGTATVPGAASFATADFGISAMDYDAGTGNTVTIKAGGVSNTQLANSAVTIGSTSTALGSTSTAVAGLTSLDFAVGNRTLFGSQASGNILTIGNHSDGVVLIKGDLQVDGTTTTINSTIVTIDDATFVVASGMTAAQADEGGFFVGTHASLTFETTGTKWQSNIPIEASSFIGNVTGSSASCTGNAATATTASSGDSATSFFSTGTIAAGRIATLNQNTTGSSASCTGNAATASASPSLTGIPSGTVVGRFDPGTGPHETKTYSQLRALMGVAAGATANAGDITGVTAGTGMSGGGTSGSVTLNCTVTGNATHTGDVTGSTGLTIGAGKVTYAKMQNVTATNRILGRDSAGAGNVEEITPTNLLTMLGVAAGATANAGDITSVTAGTGMTGGGTSGAVTLNCSITNNNQLINGEGYTTAVGDITAVTAGTGLTGGGTSGSVTLNVIGGAGITATANAIAIDSTVITTSSTIDGGSVGWS